MNYALNELLDIPTVQALLNSLDEINKLPSAILDTEGIILTATSWQDICTKFHRINHNTAKKCTESDTHIEVRVVESVSPVIYRCPMGMIDSATPIIVEGKHLGNVFIGQIFMEQPDEAYFIEQARQYGFNESNYLEAVRKAPQCSEEQLRKNLTFIGSLVQILAEQGLQSKRQQESALALKENEKKLKVIFDTSEAGIIVVSPLGIITFANRRMAEMFGMALKKLVGTHYIDHLHESEKNAGGQCMRQINNGEVKSIELIRHYIRKDGTDFWGNLTGTRFENVDGTMRDQIIVISDITERKQAEEEKRLLEEQLQQAQKMESLGVLAGGIAHDFNNILAIIMGNCSLARIKPGETEKHLSIIETAVERAAGLCRQMMAYAGKAPFDQSKVNLVVLVNQMVNILKSTIPQNVAINFDCSANIPLILGDENQLSQIVMNLIINASEAIGEAQGEISVSLTTTIISIDQPELDYLGKAIQPNCYACLEVTDNGNGMDDEAIKRIFEPFFTTKFVGRGLGMSAVLGIITAHKGALQLQSQTGQGSTFKVFLPIEPTASTGDMPLILTAPAATQLKSCTILLVEDDEQVRMAARAMLQKMGFTIIEASNGKEALEVYQRNANDINLVITDIGMPVMDGYELFQKLKSLNPILSIIVSSGFSDTVVTSRIPRNDIAGFMSKPYRFDKMQEVLKNVVDTLLLCKLPT